MFAACPSAEHTSRLFQILETLGYINLMEVARNPYVSSQELGDFLVVYFQTRGRSKMGDALRTLKRYHRPELCEELLKRFHEEAGRLTLP